MSAIMEPMSIMKISTRVSPGLSKTLRMPSTASARALRGFKLPSAPKAKRP